MLFQRRAGAVVTTKDIRTTSTWPVVVVVLRRKNERYLAQKRRRPHLNFHEVVPCNQNHIAVVDSFSHLQTPGRCGSATAMKLLLRSEKFLPTIHISLALARLQWLSSLHEVLECNENGIFSQFFVDDLLSLVCGDPASKPLARSSCLQ